MVSAVFTSKIEVVIVILTADCVDRRIEYNQPHYHSCDRQRERDAHTLCVKSAPLENGHALHTLTTRYCPRQLSPFFDQISTVLR
jgi:hypothetical protein